MIKIDNVVKNENYYTLTIADNMELFGVLFTMVPNRPVTVEFAEFDKEDPSNVLCIHPETYPDRYQELRDRYLDVLIKYINSLK